ncbi:hypothetical protein NDS46_30735 (plasmid) [Paenibacillus thiaminolyticus]|uniref:hypothetical protein n=1 Tax=Paenibacillus thiaminolyticus TaxID=49283 RepID=UPI00232B1CA2|nr:hypothetical protein [Paenibacillus thiaminolyticus]WCF11723.1 hypothetical protein NDS46_30735 [Paenibacillus thiaminolyticus]
MLAIFISLGFLTLVGLMVFLVVRKLKATDPSRLDTSAKDNITTAQEFLPFEDIKDGMICLGGHRYRAVIECSSTNYNLKTDREKEMIEIVFQRFVNSFTFPVTFYIQTKVIDNAKLLENLKEEITESTEHFSTLEEYGNIYFQEMANLNSYIGNNKQKKKYMIVAFDEAITLGDLNDDEKYKYASNELFNRAAILIDGLGSIGVKAKTLNTKELAELVFSTYHKDNYTHVENVVNGEFLTLLTEAENNRMEELPDDARLDLILYEAQMRVQTELMNDNLPHFIKQNFNNVIRELDILRDKTSGYYKQQVNVYNQSDIDNSQTEKQIKFRQS